MWFDILFKEAIRLSLVETVHGKSGKKLAVGNNCKVIIDIYYYWTHIYRFV